MKNPMPKLICMDGFSISVQASRLHYCIPRDDTGPYTHVECGYPSEEVQELLEYKDSPDDPPTRTVYAYVPIQLVCDIINSHGGLEEKP